MEKTIERRIERCVWSETVMSSWAGDISQFWIT